jgi:hypothetical protein
VVDALVPAAASPSMTACPAVLHRHGRDWPCDLDTHPPGSVHSNEQAGVLWVGSERSSPTSSTTRGPSSRPAARSLALTA